MKKKVVKKKIKKMAPGKHMDAAQDKPMVKKMVKKDAMKGSC